MDDTLKQLMIKFLVTLYKTDVDTSGSDSNGVKLEYVYGHEIDEMCTDFVRFVQWFNINTLTMVFYYLVFYYLMYMEYKYIGLFDWKKNTVPNECCKICMNMIDEISNIKNS